MKMKRLTALALSGVMAMSLATSAFAAEDKEIGNLTDLGKGASVSVTSQNALPTIKLTVPTTSSIVVNPYGMTVKADNDGVYSKGSGDGAVDDIIISAVQNILNESDVPIGVGVTATGKVPTGVTFATKDASTVSGKDKQVWLKLQLMPVADADAAKDEAFDDMTGGQELTLATTAASLKSAIVLDDVDGTNTALAFRFTGNVSKSPTTAWGEKDTVSATLAFTFTPQFVEAADA